MRNFIQLQAIALFAAAIGLSVPVYAQKAPYEATTWSTPENIVDKEVIKTLAENGQALRPPASDEVFIRRVFLDMTGSLPTPKETIGFLQDKDPEKRSRLIDTLFNRDGFSDYQTLKWADLLRVKSEFPINLWPNAVQAYQHWIRDAVSTNMPYNEFAHSLLTSSGSNFRVPEVNFYRAVQSRDPADIAKNVALTFMGVRSESMPEAVSDDLAKFFSRIGYKKTLEWKEEIVYSVPSTSGPITTSFPDGKVVAIPADSDPRQVFADWLVEPGNPWFARAIVNRVWDWLMGQGIVDPADDMRANNPPASPGLLDALATEFVKSGYDIRHLYKLILNSRTYQQSSIPHGDDAGPASSFARYRVRRLDAEVLIDALDWLGGTGESYVSATPEPYTYIPKTQKTIALADGSITSSFLVKFGRPARDTGLLSERSNTLSEDQLLYLLNSNEVKRKIDNSPLLKFAYSMPQAKRVDQIRFIYFAILSRQPLPSEEKAAEDYFAIKGVGPYRAARDLAWALVNGKEFLFRH
jgi:uncharacterized protein (TIGR02996 family)